MMYRPFIDRIRRFRWRRVIRVLLILCAVWLAFACVLATIVHIYGQTDRAQQADVIVVLGAGLMRNGSPGLALTRRTNHAAELWREGIAPYVICTGGWVQHIGRSEADGCAEVLIEQGVPADAILLEDDSRSTEENAIHVHEMMNERGWTTAVIVSDSYHVLRASWIFSEEGVTTYSSPVEWTRVQTPFYAYSLFREVIALHWQFVTDVLNLPFTYVQGI